jgi:hypothetical protein
VSQTKYFIKKPFILLGLENEDLPKSAMNENQTTIKILLGI